MLTDFDLSKQSSPAGEPTIVKNALPSMPPAIDTKSCIAHLRTNSFVGTEGMPFFTHITGQDIDWENT
jgi:hypothetical protein